LNKAGGIDKATMRMFDEKCIAKTPVFKPVQIKKIRERVKVSLAFPQFCRHSS
jgi:DNA-binding transcriptional regulator YiaG